VSSDDSGSVGLAVIGAVGLLLILVVWLAGLAAVMRAHQAATTAADAAALAAAPVTFLPFGATGSAVDEAARFARLNDAELLWCRCRVDRSFEPRTVEVLVATNVNIPIIGSVRVEASGRAEFLPALLLGAG